MVAMLFVMVIPSWWVCRSAVHGGDVGDGPLNELLAGRAAGTAELGELEALRYEIRLELLPLRPQYGDGSAAEALG